MAGLYEAHFQMFALYNRWANARLYDAAAQLPEAELTRERGAFFKSLLGTFNHLLVADRIWLGRLKGQSPRDYRLDETLFTGLSPLAEARRAEDGNLIAHVFALDEAQLRAELAYVTGSGAPQSQILHHVLAHVFNHQAHHRGQAHDLLCQIAGRDAVPVLDLLAYQRYAMPGDAPDSGEAAAFEKAAQNFFA